jgi:hypothetical protein
MSLIRIKSYHPLTEFSPSWNIPLWLTNWTDLDHVDQCRKWIVDNEKTILNLEYSNSGGTGLGEDHITTRFGRYNLLKMEDAAFGELLTFLRYSYLEYVKQQQLELKDLQIVCWANILRKDEGMDSHAHGAQPDSYLSGNVHLDDYETKTVYHSAFDPESKIALPNKKGGCVIFPSCVPHYVEKHTKDDVRVSVAFDLRLTGSFDAEFFNAVPFINKDILEDIQNKSQQQVDNQAKG